MHSPATTRALIYDLDGTLVDHDAAAQAGVESWCAELGLPEGQWPRWQDIEKRWFGRYERGEVSHLGQRIERCREFLGRSELSDDEALSLYEHYLTAYRNNWRAFDDAHDSLTAALEAGLQVGVLTNGAEAMQLRKLDCTGLLLDGVVLLPTVELGAPKPRPEAYQRALERLGVRAAEAVMVGDSWPNDVLGARKAGMTAHYLLRAGIPRDPQAPATEPVITNLTQLSWD
ncbi:HAD family hydrolase [Corynebacterium alimapuense]|uniref:HAD family hydrolase n=1 Tax=Corynebacterium alimapuense TaxID=1576874 RepID=A0A3M8KA32_9CORY|nr:HAD family hydrolase [Corynebacterium alimapuense]RNE50016.1 HAD family hydrolase [Corynebacterium alimapuense]